MGVRDFDARPHPHSRGADVENAEGVDAVVFLRFDGGCDLEDRMAHGGEAVPVAGVDKKLGFDF